MPASNGFIDFRAIKAAVTMEQVLDHYGLKEKLRPIGDDSLTGCCPIHEGHNPTQFRVSLSKNCWKCFSDCQCGGNVLDFIAKMEEVPIYDAAKLAAEWFKVPLEDTPPRDPPASAQRRREAPARNGASSPPATPPPKQQEPEPESNEPNPRLKFELKNLNPEHPYFAERGLTPESVSLFGLGHCTKGILNGRIAIPIHTGNGELVAYAGRWPGEPPDQKPKYQLPKGFRKSLEVFNLHRASHEPDDKPLVIVEGFFDCIRLWQHGIRRVVALMGNTLSTTQSAHIERITTSDSRVVVMFDEDDAGRAGRERVASRLSLLCFVRTIQFPEDKQQPDRLTAEQLHDLLVCDDIAEYETASPRFPLGAIVATPNALSVLTELDIRTAFARHVRGDWGELDADDKAANERALTEGTRLLSAYNAASGTRFWIITEADRSATTVLLPEDY